MIDCRRCKEMKPEAEFRPDARYRRGFTSWCRDCHKVANQVSAEKNRQVRAEKAAVWRQANIEKARAISREFHQRNKEVRAAQYSHWAKMNNDKRAATSAKRKAAKLRATPAWADLSKVAAFYAEARRIQRATGVKMHVDHIIPLQGETVCGLHWEGNLQVLPASVNIAKHNKLIPETRSQPVQEGLDL